MQHLNIKMKNMKFKFKNKFVKKSSLLLVLSALTLFSFSCVPPENSNVGGSTTVTNTSSNNNTSANTDMAASDQASALGDDQNPTSEEVEKGRLDEDWKNFVQLDPATEKSQSADTEKYSDISMESVNTKKQYTPLVGDVSGPSVFRAQLLLDRDQFSPGIIDGKWGKNTEKAVYWFQKKEGLPANGQVDQKTYQRLVELFGSPDKLLTEQQLSEKDVSGPFVKIPADIYEKAKMDCMCYESLTEKLSETYHITPGLLQQLNPKIKLDDLKAGDKIVAPNLPSADESPKKDVDRIVVSDGGHYVHALDAQGKILAHYPSTLGSDYNPSPSGEYKINSVTEKPSWHYQPELLDGGGGKDAMIPPGPNNAVGMVWMDLSKPHYGIHGTSAPETIGYATSHGCIRLTNWDVLALGRRVKAGTPVKFTDLSGRSDKTDDSDNTNSSNANSNIKQANSNGK